MRRKALLLAVAIPFTLLCLVGVYFLPPVHSRLAWRMDELAVAIRLKLSPPEQAEFLPQGQSTPVSLNKGLVTPSPTPKPSHTPSPTAPADTPLPSPTPTVTPTPLPGAVSVSGVKYQDQHGLWNYCAPANLAMALSFWGLDVDRLDTGKVLKPNQYDKNVMPYEMVDYVTSQTSLKAVARVGGDFDLLKRLLANGFPVLVEKGAWIRDSTGVVTWMGHYEVVTGYDDEKEIFIAQDSYFTPDYPVSYADFLAGWRSFNYAYIMIYAPEREAEVLALLGEDADETTNIQRAAQKASDEVFALTGLDQLFAWYNRGTNLKDLQDYAGAASAFDEAFSLYNTLPEDRSVRPYRILWYQTGPYFAYFYTGRYYDVISLATTALESVSDARPSLEESWYWRGMAKAALGDTAGAVEDWRESLEWHPDFPPSVYQLQLQGVEP